MSPLAKRGDRLGADAARRLEHLYEAARVLLPGFESSPAAVAAILEVIVRTIPLRSVILIEKEESRARLFAWRLPDESAGRLAVLERKALDSYAYIAGAPAGVETREERLPGAPELEADVKPIVIPLVVPDRPSFGILQFEGARALDEADLAFINSVANKISIALDRHYGRVREAALREQAERAERELSRVNEGLERAVSERTARLEQTVKDLHAFAYSIAHDLRAPLRHMHGFSQFLLGRVDADSAVYVRRIMAASERMDNLIKDLLLYSRMTLGEIQLEPVELSAVAAAAAKSLALEMGESGARLEVAKPLPRVIGHAASLVQVVENLLSNAIKFVAPGVEPRVRIRAESSGGRVRLWVEDNGIGIEAKHLERIFGVFQRLHLPEEYPGTGIGLAIVRRAMERMGGSAGVESVVDGGSRFWVELKEAKDAG